MSTSERRDTGRATQSTFWHTMDPEPAGSDTKLWVLLENVALDNFTLPAPHPDPGLHKRAILDKAHSVGLKVLGSVNSKTAAGSLALRDRLYWCAHRHPALGRGQLTRCTWCVQHEYATQRG